MASSDTDLLAFERVLLPDRFLWGVATASYQVEGGINGPGQPKNNWASWNDTGRVQPVGQALDFWRRPELLLDRTKAMGCNAFRLSLEWARVEPEPGRYDQDALAGYRQIVSACLDRKIEPVVTLQHFTHPAWAGEFPWMEYSDRFQERWGAFVKTVVLALGDRVHLWITVNEPVGLALGTHLAGRMPPGRKLDFKGSAKAVDGLLAAHCLAYDAIHDLYLEQGWPTPLVTLNNYSFCVYELDWMLVDILTHRQQGVATQDLPRHLRHRQDSWNHELRQMPGRPWSRRPLELLAQGIGRSAVGTALPRTTQAVAASPRPAKLDAVALDYYDPRLEQMIRVPGRSSSDQHRLWTPECQLWEMSPNPAGLTHFLLHAGRLGLPVLVAENGLCSERRLGQKSGRVDGWSRPAYLRQNVKALCQAIAAGVPVIGYLHWSIVDNYEWGSYAPAFGLHGVEHPGKAQMGILDCDSMGDDSAGAYRAIIEALFQIDPALRRKAFDPPHPG